MARKWFGVTEFEYKPVSEAKRADVRKRMRFELRNAERYERSIHFGTGATAAELEAVLGEARAIESELYVKVEE